MFWVSPCCELIWSSLALGYHFQNPLWSCCLDLCLWFAWGQSRCCFAAEELPRCPSQSGAKAAITLSVSSVPLPKCMWRFINLQQTFCGRKSPKASPLGMKLFLPILYTAPPKLQWISHWISSCIEKPGVLFSAAIHQTSFPRWFLPWFLPESRSLDGTNAVNGLMWAQQVLGLLLWAELVKIMSWIVRVLGQQGKRMRTLLLPCSICNSSCWQWQLFNWNSLQWERSLARWKCWDFFFSSSVIFVGFLASDALCLHTKVLFFFFFPLF